MTGSSYDKILPSFLCDAFSKRLSDFETRENLVKLSYDDPVIYITRPTPNQSTSLIDQKILKTTNKKVKKLCLEIINAERKKDEYDK